MKKAIVLILVSFILLSNFSCSSLSRGQNGAIFGAATGGVIGGVIGNQSGNTAMGAILGAAIGGAAGAYIGSYMDKQAKEIERDIEGAKIERVGEGIKITFDSGLLFDINKSVLTTKSGEELGDLAKILNKYEDTNILLEGHTDATGSDDYNLKLSRERAESVAEQLKTYRVKKSRLTIKGYGESQPIGENDTEKGRTLNRRVEIAIFANDKLKEVAKSKTEG